MIFLPEEYLKSNPLLEKVEQKSNKGLAPPFSKVDK